MAAGAGVDAHHLVGHVHRLILPLLEQFDHPISAIETRLRGGVEIRAELRKSLEFTEARQIETQTARHLLHRLRLGSTAHARHRDADVHGGSLPGEEEIGLQVDLAIGDRDHVRRNVGRHFALERLDDWQRGERTAAELLRELGRPFEQAAVGIEHVAWIGLASRWPTHQKR